MRKSAKEPVQVAEAGESLLNENIALCQLARFFAKIHYQMWPSNIVIIGPEPKRPRYVLRHWTRWYQRLTNDSTYHTL